MKTCMKNSELLVIQCFMLFVISCSFLSKCESTQRDDENFVMDQKDEEERSSYLNRWLIYISKAHQSSKPVPTLKELNDTRMGTVGDNVYLRCEFLAKKNSTRLVWQTKEAKNNVDSQLGPRNWNTQSIKQFNGSVIYLLSYLTIPLDIGDLSKTVQCAPKSTEEEFDRNLVKETKLIDIMYMKYGFQNVARLGVGVGVVDLYLFSSVHYLRLELVRISEAKAIPQIWTASYTKGKDIKDVSGQFLEQPELLFKDIHEALARNHCNLSFADSKLSRAELDCLLNVKRQAFPRQFVLEQVDYDSQRSWPTFNYSWALTLFVREKDQQGGRLHKAGISARVVNAVKTGVSNVNKAITNGVSNIFKKIGLSKNRKTRAIQDTLNAVRQVPLDWNLLGTVNKFDTLKKNSNTIFEKSAKLQEDIN